MFKKTRIKITALIMAIATVIITLMLSVIYIANANYAFERGRSLLERYIEDNSDFFHPFDLNTPEHPGMKPGMKDDRNKMFRVSTFYSVFYDQDNIPVRINHDGGVLYTEQEILDIANDIISSGKTGGIYNKMPFLVKSDANGTIIALIDNTMEMDNTSKLFKYCLITGISGWVIIFIIALFFSKKIIDPLELSNTKQKQFISDASHELKTPISVISANSDLLSVEIGENKWLSNIQYENEKMGELVISLLELVRAENMSGSKELIDFSRLISGESLPFESLAFEKGLSLETDIDNGVFVNGNKSKLCRLCSILIDNAISHGTPNKDVVIKLKTTKHHAVLSVINHGDPIPEETKEMLFERFYRLDESRTSADGHYGLGLAIAKAIVNSHNGKIEIINGNDTIEFKVSIPKK